MAAGRNGLILLGYARSAGSGDQNVPGVVTSRRDRGQQQRQKDKVAAKHEEERLVRQRQEVAAQYLKKKWKEEDKKRKRRARDGDVDDEDERPPRKSYDDEDGEQAEDKEEEAEPEADGGKWVSIADAKKRVLPGPIDMHTIEPPQGHSNSGQKAPDRRGILQQKTMAIDPATSQKRKAALANAFGMEDDDDGESRRELELAARMKRQRVDARLGDSLPGAAASAAAAAPARGGGTDMFDQLRRLAEWKRKCKGNRIPMPDDLVKLIGQTAGLDHSQPQTTLGRDTNSSGPLRRPPSRSRSRSGGGSRSFAQQRRRSPSRKRRKSRSRSQGKSSKGGTRAVL